MRSTRGWGWGGFSEHTWLSLTIKSVTFFKTLGTELQMCPIMSWDVLPGYKRCVGYGKQAPVLLCRDRKRQRKVQTEKEQLESTGGDYPYCRGPIPGATAIPERPRRSNPTLLFSILGAAAPLAATQLPFHSPPTSALGPQPPARGLPGADRPHRPPPRPPRSGQGQHLRSAIALRVWAPPRHVKGAIVIIKNKTSCLLIVCTYWPLLPSSQTHLQYSQKPWASLFSLCCLAWSRDKCIPCYSLPLRRHL